MLQSKKTTDRLRRFELAVTSIPQPIRNYVFAFLLMIVLFIMVFGIDLVKTQDIKRTSNEFNLFMQLTTKYFLKDFFNIDYK